jgi:hypothetical protein
MNREYRPLLKKRECMAARKGEIFYCFLFSITQQLVEEAF